jgi:nitrate reductase NapE component
MAKKETDEKKVEPRPKNQAILTLFILIFPVLILAMVGLVGDWFTRVFLFVYEAVLIKNFIDSYYTESK